MTVNTKNIIFEAANYETSTELLLIEKKEGDFELHLVQDAGISEDGKEFINNAVSIKLDIRDIARLIDATYHYLERDGGIEI